MKYWHLFPTDFSDISILIKGFCIIKNGPLIVCSRPKKNQGHTRFKTKDQNPDKSSFLQSIDHLEAECVAFVWDICSQNEALSA